jgi:hypothetical protein
LWHLDAVRVLERRARELLGVLGRVLEVEDGLLLGRFGGGVRRAGAERERERDGPGRDAQRGTEARAEQGPARRAGLDDGRVHDLSPSRALLRPGRSCLSSVSSGGIFGDSLAAAMPEPAGGRPAAIFRGWVVSALDRSGASDYPTPAFERRPLARTGGLEFRSRRRRGGPGPTTTRRSAASLQRRPLRRVLE